MRTKSGLMSFAALAVAALLLAGCGGGGGGSKITTGTLLTILTDTAVSGSLSVSRDTNIAAPLNNGVAVAYDFRTGQEITRSPLDSNGRCTMRLSPGLTVAVVITGTRQGKTYRLSTVIPVTPQSTEEYRVDPVTSLAAEAVAMKHYRENKVIDQGTWDAVMEAAQEFAQSNPGTDYSVGGGVFGNASFGQPGCLDDSVAEDLLDAVPDTIDNSLAQSKNAVQQIKEAGVSLQNVLSQEAPDAQSIVTRALLDRYGALGERIGKLIGPALFGEIHLDNYERVSVFELTPGRVYRAVEGEWGGIFVTDAGAGTAGQIRINMADDGETYTLIASRSGSTWTITQSFTGDSQQQYRVTVPEIPENPGANPSYSAGISLRDSVFTTAITFEGTISATGSGSSSYTRLVFNGTLGGPNVTSTGRLEVNFPSTKPAGAREDQTIYNFPTSLSMANARVSVTNAGKTITVTGSINVGTAVIEQPDGIEAVPKTASLTGGYSNSSSKIAFEGNITADWSNPGAGQNLSTVVGTVSMTGEITRTGYSTYYANFAFTLNNGSISTDIDLRAGSNTLTGRATGTLTRDGVQNASLNLTNQAGVKFSLASESDGSVAGTITADSKKTADICIENGLLRIDYTDGTFEQF